MSGNWINIGWGNGLSPDLQQAIALTHWGRDKMAAISQATFSNAFCSVKMYGFWLRFLWSLFLSFELTISQHCSDNGMTPTRRQAIIWTNDGIVYWCIYVSLGLDMSQSIILLSIRPLGTTFIEICVKYFLPRNILKMLLAKFWPFCSCLCVLTQWGLVTSYGNRDLGQHWLR